jgi:hypothetical protein
MQYTLPEGLLSDKMLVILLGKQSMAALEIIVETHDIASLHYLLCVISIDSETDNHG